MPPRTDGPNRELRLLPNLPEVLRAMAQPLHTDKDTYFFRNPEDRPITAAWWLKKSWYPVLRALGIKPRKFYATRHTFISVALSNGCNLKWVAEFYGTSVQMIEKSYGRYIADDGAEPLVRSLRGAKTQTLPQTFVEEFAPWGQSAAISRGYKMVPGGIENQKTLEMIEEFRCPCGRVGRHKAPFGPRWAKVFDHGIVARLTY